MFYFGDYSYKPCGFRLPKMTVPYVFVLPIIEQVYSFKYLGNLISYKKEVDIDNKLNSYLKITGTINSVSRPQKALKKTRMKLYSTVAIPVVLRSSEKLDH